jgi:hypothetical protein
VIELHLSPEDIAALRKRERASDSADLTFRCCPFCAFPEWMCTRGEGTGQTYISVGDQLCSLCADLRYGNPHAFEMVMRALRGAKLLDRWTAKARSK